MSNDGLSERNSFLRVRSAVVKACRDEPSLRTVSPSHLVEIPQRMIRQPRRRREIPAPPLIRMLDVGRGGAEVRVRTYLWLWASLSVRSYADVTLRRTTGEWAVLANVLDPQDEHNQAKRSAAARRVTRALDYLEAHRLVSRPQVDLVQLLDPDGLGRMYVPWSDGYLREREVDREKLEVFFMGRDDLRRSQLWEDEPLRLPAKLWTNGTISSLSAAATAVLLILWDYETEPGELIIVPKSRAFEYPVNHSSWHKGLAELERAGLVHKVSGPLIFSAANANPKVTSDRHRADWRIDHAELLQ